ncbi:hypothetical protein BH09BAC4_BH09BAC4_18940 [soil metagenome]
MTEDADVLIIGGGLAGLTAAIHLAKYHVRVILIEKQAYPHHKVCGEYISNEVLPYLQFLGITVDDLNPSRIHRFLLSTVSGKTIESDLPLGGFGVSRYAFDHFLYKKALALGVTIHQQQVVDIQFTNDVFTATTDDGEKYTAHMAIGAYGKRSALDKQLQRKFILKESPWLGVKMHYQATFPNDLVSLHNFDGGYCGLSQVEDGIVNACYLVSYSSFKKYKNVKVFQANVLYKNPHLRNFLTGATALFDKPLVISQLSFSKKEPVENHILMCGDTAGLIHPLCGNGMAMAIHSAKLASDLLIRYFQREITNRLTVEKQYTLSWNDEFKRRLAIGRLLQSVLYYPALTNTLLKSLQLTPRALPLLIKQTHGKPLIVGQAG